MREPTKVACLHYRIPKLFSAGRHGATEDFALVGVCRPILPHPGTMDVVERGVAAAHCIQEIAPRRPITLAADRFGHFRVRPGDVSPMQLAKRPRLQPPLAVLVTYPDRA